MKHISCIMAAGLLAASTSVAAADIGVRGISVPVPERGGAITATVWYPAAGKGEPVKVGDNAIFQGAEALQDAEILPGMKRVILLSHGGLRSAPGVESWIAAALAEKGFVVAVPHAPKVKAADAPAEYWLRPADMSATLTALERDPALAGKADTANASALGFFLGGTAALALAGAEMDAGQISGMCDNEARNPDCNWFRKSGVDLHQVDFGRLQQPSRDPRVKAVVAVSPELTASTTPARFAVPVHVITLGAGKGPAVQHASHEVLSEATPFDAFNRCKPKAPYILRAEGEDEGLCAEGPRPRADTHAHLVEVIAQSFTEQALASE